MSDEYAGLILEDELLDHLATSEGAYAVWKERLLPEVIPDSDEGIRDALTFVISYMDEYRAAPPIEVITDETGYDEFNEPKAPIAYVIAKLRDRYKRQEARKIITKMGRLSAVPDEAIQHGLTELSRLRLETSERGGMITSDNMFGVIDDYRIRIQSDAQQGVSFGYEAIDTWLGGLHLGEVVVVMARPKRYKSWQLLKSAEAAIMDFKPVSFATMELSEKEMRDRFGCMVAGVSWDRFVHHMLDAREEDMLEDAARFLIEHPAKVNFFRPKPGERTVEYLTAMAIEQEAEVLYVDQLSWFDGAKDDGNWRIIGKIMEELKDAAQHFPIYMAAQYNRVQSLEEGIGDLANIGLSDAIGQTADTLLGLYASKDMHHQGILHMGIVESRRFQQQSWELKVELSKNSNFRLLNTLQQA